MAVKFMDLLSDQLSVALRSKMTITEYRRDEVIIGQDERTKDVFFVLEGLAQVTVYSEDGKKVAFRTIDAGAVFGELAAIDNLPRSASVIALEKTKAGRLPAAVFRALVESEPAFTWTLLGHLSSQVRDMTDRIYEYSTKLVRERLILELKRLARLGDGALGIIQPAPTHFDLAARISCHREAVSREMSRLTKAGIIAKAEGVLTIRDMEKLIAELPEASD